jgi:hypothetical protein
MKSRDFFHPGLPRLAACALLVFALPRGSGWADMADILRAQGFHEAPISRNLNKNEDFIEIQIIRSSCSSTRVRKSRRSGAPPPRGRT